MVESNVSLFLQLHISNQTMDLCTLRLSAVRDNEQKIFSYSVTVFSSFCDVPQTHIISKEME
jgi:hypothetical protein